VIASLFDPLTLMPPASAVTFGGNSQLAGSRICATLFVEQVRAIGAASDVKLMAFCRITNYPHLPRPPGTRFSGNAKRDVAKLFRNTAGDDAIRDLLVRSRYLVAIIGSPLEAALKNMK